MSSSTEPVLIGEAVRLTGVSAKMIRHYEALGLLPAPPRSEGGYRRYSAEALQTLRFIRSARDLGFGTGDIQGLLTLWQNPRRASAQVKRLATRHIAALDARIRDMQAMRDSLSRLAGCCPGDEQAECPILDELAQPHTESP